jgi:hypothetical protein
MGSFKHSCAFDPLDLEIIDRVYEAAWAKLEACEPFRDRERDLERQEALRKQMACATAGHGPAPPVLGCEQVFSAGRNRQSSATVIADLGLPQPLILVLVPHVFEPSGA